MTMIVNFADGFTSSTEPNLIGLGNEVYDILNNQATPVEITGLNFNGYTSVSGICEIERVNNTDSYRQTIDFKMRKDDVSNDWELEFGGFIGDELVVDSLSLQKEITLTIDADGQMFYSSGNMSSLGYAGKLKLNLTRINT
jgi:hypothetical protein